MKHGVLENGEVKLLSKRVCNELDKYGLKVGVVGGIRLNGKYHEFDYIYKKNDVHVWKYAGSKEVQKEVRQRKSFKKGQMNN